MKFNKIKIRSTEANVELTLTPRIPLAFQLLLILICSVVFIAPMLLIAHAQERDQGLIFMGSLVFYIVMYIMVGKYTLWNLFGEERLIVSTKAVNYQHHFGFFETPWKAKKFNKLYLQFGKAQEINGANYGKLEFITEDENGVYISLYCTSIMVGEDKIQEAVEYINILFIEESLSKFGIIHVN